jgi:hypothetical protein
MDPVDNHGQSVDWHALFQQAAEAEEDEGNGSDPGLPPWYNPHSSAQNVSTEAGGRDGTSWGELPRNATIEESQDIVNGLSIPDRATAHKQQNALQNAFDENELGVEGYRNLATAHSSVVRGLNLPEHAPPPRPRTPQMPEATEALRRRYQLAAELVREHDRPHYDAAVRAGLQNDQTGLQYLKDVENHYLYTTRVSRQDLLEAKRALQRHGETLANVLETYRIGHPKDIEELQRG